MLNIIYANRALSYLWALFIYFFPPITCVLILHLFGFTKSSFLVPILIVIPFGFSMGYLVRYSLLKNSPVIYNLPEKKEKVLKITIMYLIIKMSTLGIFFAIILKIFNLESSLPINLFQVVGFYGATFIMSDLSFYFFHRFLHNHKFLFRHIHRDHHRALVPSLISSINIHVVEMLVPIGFTLVLVVIVIQGISFFHAGPIDYHVTESWVLGTMMALQSVEYLSALGHSNREFIPYKALHLFPFNYLGTPIMHALHHSRIKCSYGAYLSVWDKLFKTFPEDYDLFFKRVSEGKPLSTISEKVGS